MHSTAYVDLEAERRRSEEKINAAITRNSALVAALLEGENVPVDDLKLYVQAPDGRLKALSKEEIDERKKAGTLLDEPQVLCQTKAAHGKKLPVVARAYGPEVDGERLTKVAYHQPSEDAQRARELHEAGPLPALGSHALDPDLSLIALHVHAALKTENGSSVETDTMDTANIRLTDQKTDTMGQIREVLETTSSPAWRLKHIERETGYLREEIRELKATGQSTATARAELEEWESLRVAIELDMEDELQLTKGSKAYAYWYAHTHTKVIDEQNVLLCGDSYATRPRTFVSAATKGLDEIADELTR